MKIYSFAIDPETGIIFAYYTVNGKRFRSIVCSQAGRNYVRTGSKVGGDLELHFFNDAQNAAFNSFLSSADFSIDYSEAIA